ncbi:hypothetical protein PISMIDRAFT_685676 [Pisolithus microcarpus 441]|uniref:Uncharacterized protein n=1 Tax=Pisolithus microcarpus 441 TaxID=765257 RepID=A0A0C9YKD9_9AGAM|nr:hypothetical protein PISMIDRAFT_685676 [Pisolithus microcarpus 441]
MDKPWINMDICDRGYRYTAWRRIACSLLALHHKICRNMTTRRARTVISTAD